MITEPGIYEGVDERAYHADTDLAPELGRSLSASGAKGLIENERRYLWERDHGRPPKDAYDLGTVAHTLVLRSGDNRIRVWDGTDWKTKASQEWKRAQYADGLIPIHRDDLRRASKIAQAVKRHPIAGPLFANGRPEVTLYWIDATTGITCRARIDWVHPKALVDLKTAAYGRGTEDAFGKSAASFDYPMPAAHYRDGWAALTGQVLPFITVTVETDAPYFVTVGQYKHTDLAMGRERIERARELFAELESRTESPAPGIVTFDLPGWYGLT